MKIYGLTGGVATGKSTVVKMINTIDSNIVIFDADACVHRLYKRDYVLDEIKTIFGSEAVVNDELSKSYLREVIFNDAEMKRLLQNLIHPMVRKECLDLKSKSRQSDRASMFIADIPLLFESEFDFSQEANLVVAVSRETQVQRLKMRSGFSDATVYAILEAQLPISYKEKCADVVLWNEGPKTVLKAQILRFIEQHRT